MAWKVEFERAAQKELEKLGKTVSRRILKFLHQRVAKLDDKRQIGERLTAQRLLEIPRWGQG
jgi:mRNA interferase RelE/StbE